MFYRENGDQPSSLPKLSLYSTLEDEIYTPETYPGQYWLNGNLQQNPSNSTSNNQFQLIGNQSFHTIPRNSLRMLPDPYGMQISEDKYCLALKHSNNSILVGSDDEDQADLETKLITETQEMTINQDSDEQVSPLQFGLLDSLHREISKHQNHRLSKVFTGKQIKNLLRELRCRHNYDERVKGHFIIKTDTELVTIKQGHVKLIIQKKAVITGLIIQSNEERIKLRVLDERASKKKVSLQFWRDCEQNWVQATLAARLKYIRGEKYI